MLFYLRCLENYLNNRFVLEMKIKKALRLRKALIIKLPLKDSNFGPSD